MSIASRVHVQVVDSITGAPFLSNAIVRFNDADIDGLSSIDGLVDLGTPLSGGDSVTVSLSGYALQRNWTIIGSRANSTPLVWRF